MAQSISHSASNGGLHLQSIKKKAQSSAQTFSKKGNKKPKKSNITNKIKSLRSQAVPAADGSDSDDTVGDSGAGDEQVDAAEQPDVFALSDAAPSVSDDHSQRLAGYDIDDDMFNDTGLGDTHQAVAEDEFDGFGTDDEDYAGVENVSDSEASDDEVGDHSILRSAEKDLIDEFERTEERQNANSMTSELGGMALDEEDTFAQILSLPSSTNTSGEFSFDIDLDNDPFVGLNRNDYLYNDMWDEAESALWRMPAGIRGRTDSNGSATTTKRVRFADAQPMRSSASSSEDPAEAFPDLFASSDDPSIKQQLAISAEQDARYLDNDYDDAESQYDFEDPDEMLAFRVDEESDSDSDISDSESDEGDTTDEETAEEQIARMRERKRAAGTSTVGGVDTPSDRKRVVPAAVRTPTTSRPTTPNSGKGPRTGTFAIDPTRATLTAYANGKKIKTVPPTKPPEKDRGFWERARTANSSRNNSPRDSSYMTIPSSAADSIPDRPFTAKSTLGSMFNGNLDILRNNDTAGIAASFLPASMGRSITMMSGTIEGDSDTAGEDINMQDFIDLDDSASDSDATPSAPVTPHPGLDTSSSFSSQEERHDSLGDGLLNHFDRCGGIVGSFRRNQNQAKHFSSLASHPAKRASTSEYNALQKGRRGAANTPMTPARKKRASQDLSQSGAGIRKSLQSPLTSRRPRSRGNSLAAVSDADLYQTLTQNPFEQS